MDTCPAGNACSRVAHFAASTSCSSAADPPDASDAGPHVDVAKYAGENYVFANGVWNSSASEWLPALPAGSCFVAWSDVLVFFDARGVDFSGEGFTVFGHEGSVAYGAAHAVMVLEPADASAAFGPGVARRSATYPCRHFFEKASPETLRRAGAVLPPSAEGGNGG